MTLHVAHRFSDQMRVVNEQLPPGIRDKIYVDLRRDPHGLKTMAWFYRAERGHPGDKLGSPPLAECELESLDFDGYSRMLKIPENVISHLCVVV